jgi:hypothetical protein
MKVTAIRSEGGKRLLTAKFRAGCFGGWTEEYMLDVGGLHLLSGITGKLDPFRTVLKYPVRSGESWTNKYLEVGMETECKSTVLQPETVTVAGGTFVAFPVTSVITVGDSISTGTEWFAESVGIVKLAVKGPGATIELELTNYDLG